LRQGFSESPAANCFWPAAGLRPGHADFQTAALQGSVRGLPLTVIRSGRLEAEWRLRGDTERRGKSACPGARSSRLSGALPTVLGGATFSIVGLSDGVTSSTGLQQCKRWHLALPA